MNLILLIASAAEIAIATIILWYVVDLLTTMPANMRMVVKYLIVLVPSSWSFRCSSGSRSM